MNETNFLHSVPWMVGVFRLQKVVLQHRPCSILY